MEKLIKSLKKPMTAEEALALIESYIKPLSWYNYLKWEEFIFWDLMMRYDEKSYYTIIWKNGTPLKEREKGAKVLIAIRNEIIVIDP